MLIKLNHMQKQYGGININMKLIISCLIINIVMCVAQKNRLVLNKPINNITTTTTTMTTTTNNNTNTTTTTNLYQKVANTTNNSNKTGSLDPVLIEPQRGPMYIALPITIIYSLIFIIGIFGNIITCFVIIRDKTMHTVTNCYLFNLAVSDIIFLIFGVPFETYSLWWISPYAFGPAFCPIRALISETSTNASVLTITLFTVERYLAICFPFEAHNITKPSRTARQVLVLWILALIFALPGALEFGVRAHFGVPFCFQIRTIIEYYFEISTFLFFFTPMVLIAILCSLIGLELKKGSTKVSGVKELKQEMGFTPEVQKKHSQATTRVIKLLVAVVVAFFICWAPFHAQRLLVIYSYGKISNENSVLEQAIIILTHVSGVFYYLSTCINPILYHIMSNKFREAFKKTLIPCCRLSARG